MDSPLTSNNLLTTIEIFSEIACLDGRAFGVETFCENCDIEFNECLQTRLLQNLIANQSAVEKEVGYNLTKRYHEEEILWDGSAKRIQLEWPGLAAINVVKDVTVLEGSTSVSPYVILDAPVTDSGSGYYVVELDHYFVTNPNDAIIRNAVTDEVIQVQEVSGYPRRNGDGNWLVALGKPAPPTAITVNVQHCRYMVAIRTTPDCDGDLYMVREDEETIIPFAKSETVSGTDTTYWVHPWSMVDEAFQGESVDLVSGEFYKLIDTVKFICVTDTEALPIVTEYEGCRCGNDAPIENDELIVFDIVSAQDSIVQIRFTEEWCNCRCKKPVKIKVFYRTDPSLVVPDGSLLALQEAIAYLTAAELPASSCGCTIGIGFIADAKKPFADFRINPITGETIANVKFNSLTGQLVFAEKLSKAYKYKKSIRL